MLSYCVVSFERIKIFADDSPATVEQTNEFTVSKPMTYSEMAQHFANENGIDYATAFKTLYPDLYKVSNGNRVLARAARTRELSVYINVSYEYKPRLAFYCNTDEQGNYWGITSIYRVTLYRYYNNLVKAFSGELDAWLISPYQIEYMINGDFYNTATQTSEVTIGGSFTTGDLINIQGSISTSSSTNYYKYCYEHKTVSFQS